MVQGTTDRRRLAEQQLFEVHARLSRARSELEIIEAQLDVISAAAEHARARMRVAETLLAEREWCEVRRRRAALVEALDAALVAIARLEYLQDGLLAKLVG